LKFGVPIKLLLPGVELDKNEVHQLHEVEFFTIEDYDRLKRLGAFRFLWNVAGRLHPEMKGLKAIGPFISTIFEMRRHRKMIERAGSRLACGFVLPGILADYFSFGRSLEPFIIDMIDYARRLDQ